MELVISYNVLDRVYQCTHFVTDEQLKWSNHIMPVNLRQPPLYML